MVHDIKIFIQHVFFTNIDQSAQFNNIVAGYESLNRLTGAIANSVIPFQQHTVQHTLIDIVWDYHEITSLMQDATPERERFHTQALAVLEEEMVEITPNRNIARSDQNHYNGSICGNDNWEINDYSCPITYKV